MSTALVVLYLQTQDSLNIEWPSGSEAQAQRERRVRWDDALILWHSELITQLFHTLQSPGHWQSCLIIHHNAAAVPPGQDKKGWVKREKSQIIHCGIFYHWSSFLLRKFFMVFFFQIHFWICKLSNSYPCSLNYCGMLVPVQQNPVKVQMLAFQLQLWPNAPARKLNDHKLRIVFDLANQAVLHLSYFCWVRPKRQLLVGWKSI